MAAHKIRAKLFAAVLTAVFLVGVFFPLQVNAQAQTEDVTEYYSLSYVWPYDGETWSLNLSIPQAVYADYQGVSVSTRNSAGYSYLITSIDTYVQNVANRIHAAAVRMGYEEYDEVSFILAFVNSLSNTGQSTSALPDGYPNFPVETLVEEGGDCEDNSILLAALLTALGYNVIIIDIDGHIGVGVSGDAPPGKSFYWFYYDKEHYSDKEFYYCETVGGVWKLGECPEAYQHQDAQLSQVLVGKQYISSANLPEFFHTISNGHLKKKLGSGV
jgi:hypothetical protein